MCGQVWKTKTCHEVDQIPSVHSYTVLESAPGARYIFGPFSTIVYWLNARQFFPLFSPFIIKEEFKRMSHNDR